MTTTRNQDAVTIDRLPYNEQHRSVIAVHQNLSWLVGRFSLTDIALVLNAYLQSQPAPTVPAADKRESVFGAVQSNLEEWYSLEGFDTVSTRITEAVMDALAQTGGNDDAAD